MDRDQAAKQEGDHSIRLAYDHGPRAEESAFWTVVDGMGQMVLAGWCLSTATLMVLLGMGRLRDTGELAPLIDGVLAVLFVGLGAVLMLIGARFFMRGVRAAHAAWRKVCFGITYRRHGDARSAWLAVDGDPVLEPYLRYLMKRDARQAHPRSHDAPPPHGPPP